MYSLYDNVLSARLDGELRACLQLEEGDRYAEIRYMLQDYYTAKRVVDECWPVDDLLSSPDIGLVGMVRSPHTGKERESGWRALTQRKEVTLSVDLFDIGIVFTCDKLSKQNVVFRCY